MLQGILADGQEMEVLLPQSYTTLYQRLAAYFNALDEVTMPRLVHWDLWDGNIFIDPPTGKITGVIDFERVLWGDPLIEVIFADANPQSNAVMGFGQPLLSSEDQVRRRLLYTAYLYLIMVIECYYRRYKDHWQENWAREQLDLLLKKF
jgi:aminoglycoside phosphotransferase (APT) family kinase protein